MNEQEQRLAVIKEAKEFIGTPYHSNARVKGKNGGVDCLTILSGVFENVGLIPRVSIPHYSPQFMLNRHDELYMTGLMEYCHEVSTPLMGDIALWKFGRCFSHAAIVIDWPNIIHAYVNASVKEDNVDKCVWLKQLGTGLRPVKYFSFWGK